MKTNKGLYDLHTYYNTDPYELYEAYQNVPLDSLDENHDNNTPLHTACCFADKIAVTILLERGADVNQKNDKGYTPAVPFWPSINLVPTIRYLPK